MVATADKTSLVARGTCCFHRRIGVVSQLQTIASALPYKQSLPIGQGLLADKIRQLEEIDFQLARCTQKT
jgi:adenosine deaminase